MKICIERKSVYGSSVLQPVRQLAEILINQQDFSSLFSREGGLESLFSLCHAVTLTFDPLTLKVRGTSSIW